MPRATAHLLQNYSVDVAARDRSAPDVCGEHLPRGSEIYVVPAPGETHHQLVAAARQLSLSGFHPVPHIVARDVPSYTRLNDLLSRLAGDAGVTSALVIGGDSAHPAGPYESSVALLQTGLFGKHGIGRIGLACYPEAHPRIGAAALGDALRRKLGFLKTAGLDPFLVTQFCFEATPIIQLARSLKADGIVLPLRVGVAGPADRRTLWKQAIHTGVGTSIRSLGDAADAIGDILVQDTPDALLDELTPAAAALGIDGIHIFAFGGVAAAATWANAHIAAG